MNSSEFLVSVVTPVFNAARFLRRSVEAAVHQREVGEIILIEDASPDESLAVCKQLASEHEKVRLLQHPDRKNHGAGASRNLGIKSARFDYVAFSDADNFYLPNRFEVDKDVFLSDESIDGVYGMEGIHYYSEEARKIFADNIEGELADHETLTVSDRCPPDELYLVWLGEHPSIHGEFGMDAITVRKRIFEKSGLFEPSLRLQQDHDLFTRFATVGKLVAGSIDNPIALRGVHENQRMTDLEAQYKYSAMRMENLYKWFYENISDKQKLQAIDRAYWKFRLLRSSGRNSLVPTIRATWSHGWSALVEPYGIFDQGMHKFLGERWVANRVLSAKRRVTRTLGAGING